MSVKKQIIRPKDWEGKVIEVEEEIFEELNAISREEWDSILRECCVIDFFM